MNMKNILSTRRHGEHGGEYGGTPYFLCVRCAGKAFVRRPQRRNFVPQNSESPCPLCLRVDNLLSMSMDGFMRGYGENERMSQYANVNSFPH
jgi:hypothetical protein